MLVDDGSVIFDRDRTICDVIRYELKMVKEVFNYAIKAYVKDSKKNIRYLLNYSEIMRIKSICQVTTENDFIKRVNYR